ncbi:MAG: hypothetical protein ACP5NU_03705 [Methanomicrobiales archaeon]|jgi:DNA-binding HxlR family transcriptional regulator|nr:hypothetical protein [Methanoregulaceae archaeon]MCC7468138.1 hypothetical protein [Burkholderiaceae bacterium]NLH25123.1 hypothetical protein [Methanomicrobiales archaeon]HNB02815.1 hypothetical protein [Methanoregulaceae archaeon]HNI41425.1 hypothetical protein [Methanoregulaceae archaeon]
MDDHIIEPYLDMVPYEIRDAVMSLSNTKKWAIFIILVKEGEMRFNKIKEHVGSDKSPEIDRALKALIKGGLVEKVAHDPAEIGNLHKSWYTASELGLRFIGCLGDIFSPVPRHQASYLSRKEEIIPSVMERGMTTSGRRGLEPGSRIPREKSERKLMSDTRKSR